MKKPMVAVVEDDVALLKAMGRLLAASGFEAALFSSAEMYWESRSTTAADCLLLDIELAGMSGLELQKKLRAEKRALPVIFVSGQSDIPSIARAIDEGCLAYLYKPFDARILIETVRAAMAAGCSF